MKRKVAAHWLSLALALLVALTPGLAAQVKPELPDPGTVAGITKEQQIQIGLQAMAEVYKQMPVLTEPHPVTRYVQHLGRKLESVIPPDYSWPYQFNVSRRKISMLSLCRADRSS